MKQVAIILIFFICACSNEKKHEIDDSFFSFWIKGIIADSVIQETGSLLAEPFSKRANNLPDIIYLSPHKTNSGSRHNIVHSIFDIKDSLHEVQISNKEICTLLIDDLTKIHKHTNHLQLKSIFENDSSGTSDKGSEYEFLIGDSNLN